MNPEPRSRGTSRGQVASGTSVDDQPPCDRVRDARGAEKRAQYTTTIRGLERRSRVRTQSGTKLGACPQVFRECCQGPGESKLVHDGLEREPIGMSKGHRKHMAAFFDNDSDRPELGRGARDDAQDTSLSGAPVRLPTEAVRPHADDVEPCVHCDADDLAAIPSRTERDGLDTWILHEVEQIRVEHDRNARQGMHRDGSPVFQRSHDADRDVRRTREFGARHARSAKCADSAAQCDVLTDLGPYAGMTSHLLLVARRLQSCLRGGGSRGPLPRRRAKSPSGPKGYRGAL